MSKQSAVLAAYFAEILDQVERVKEKIQVQKDPTSVNHYPWLVDFIALFRKYPKIRFELPPAHVEADIAVEGFSKEELEMGGQALRNISFIERVQQQGIYLNLQLSKGAVYRMVLGAIEALNSRYGDTDINKNKRAVIEYSSPNITKPIGVGHLRSTIIGEALARVYEATGYGVVRENYLGDWGTQFGKVIYAYENWGNAGALKKDPINHLKELYVKFHEEAEKNPELDIQARAIFKRLEEADDELLKTWKYFRDISIEDFKKIYKILDVDFDAFTGEGMTRTYTGKIIEETKALGLAKESDGAVVVDGLDNLPSFLLEKQDGSTLYLTRDLVTLGWRIKEFEPNDILYVVGAEQNLHFKQLFALARALRLLDKVGVFHVGFGFLLVDGKRMSTRRGTLVELRKLIDESISKSAKIVKEKNPELGDQEVEEISKIVGVGAIVYNDLRQSREKNVNFDWDRMLNFETGSAAYLQYTYARIQSILRKATSYKLKAESLVFKHESEWQLARKLMFFPQVIWRAQELRAPHVIATYLEELAQLFNAFYGVVQILKTENEVLKASRLTLIASVAQIIKNGLELLNVKVPERM